MDHDNVLNMLSSLDINNAKGGKVKVILLPCYLTGDGGIMNMSYYDLVLGNDLCVYPSYYEPWGYTPLESIAFRVPCITTDLTGLGLWANTEKGKYSEIEDGVKILHRTDYNYSEVADGIKDTMARYSCFTKTGMNKCRSNTGKLSRKALWSEFIIYYEQAYSIALKKAAARNK